MNKYDIIVPTYNLSCKTIECFRRVVKFTSNYRLIWIDNNSDIKEFDAVKEFLNSNKVNYIMFRLSENLGFVKATNMGLAVATAPWRVLLNNDVYVTENWLDHMTNCADTYGYDLVGPLTSPNAGSYQGVVNMKKNIRENIPNWDLYEIDSYAKKISQTMNNDHVHVKNGMIAFFCTAIRDRVIIRIGYLSEEYGIGLGDDDGFCYVAIKNGFKLGIDLGTFVQHDHRSTFKSLYSKDQIADMQSKALDKYK